METPVLGSFELRTRIASGGMGTVWLARHQTTLSLAAVKVLSEDASDPMYVEGFMREVRAVATLRHPRIITVYDFGLVPDSGAAEGFATGSPWLAMELATRGSLLHARGIDDFTTVRSLLLDIMDGLAHSHARGIIHRDIKPGNVLLVNQDDEVRAKLSDFGIAHAKGERLETREVFASSAGTPWYMSPEQIQSRWRDYGPWTDLYALGCLAYELVAGQTPFTGEPVRVARAHLLEEAPPLAPRFAVPEGFLEWVERLISKDIGARFQRVADAAWALRRMTSHWDEPASKIETRQIGEGDCAEGETHVTSRWSGDSSLETLIFDSADELPTLDEIPLPEETRQFSPPRAAAIRFGPPPIPESWRTRDEEGQHRISEAGLGLFGLRETPFVGREDERDSIWQALRHTARTKTPAAIGIRGPIGAGKTRLAQWAAQRAHEIGVANLFWANHSALPGPNDGLEAMFEDYLGCHGLDAQRTWERISSLPNLRDEDGKLLAARLTLVLHPDADLGSFGAPAVRVVGIHERFATLSDLILVEARERPALLVIDDAHLGAETVEFARFMMRRAGSAALFLLTFPRVFFEETDAESAALEELIGRNNTHVIDIDPIDSADHARLLDGTLGLEPRLRDRLIASSAGNPLYSLQMLEEWVARNKLKSESHGFVLEGELHLPEDLNQLWIQRLRTALANPGGEFDETLPALEIAAHMGSEVYFNEWSEVCRRLGLTPFAGLVDQLSAQGLLQWTDHGFRFAHRPLREALIVSAENSGRARDQHRATAIELSRREHTLRNARRRTRHLLEAGEWGLALTPLLEVVNTQLERGRLSAAGAAIRKARMAVSEAGIAMSDRRYLNLLDLRVQYEFHQRNLAEVEEIATQLLDLTNDDEHAALRATGWQFLCTCASRSGRFEDAAEYAERSIECARRANSAEALARALRTAAWLAMRTGDYHLSDKRFREALDVFAALGDSAKASACLAGLSEVARQQSRLDEAFELIEEAIELRAEFQDPNGLSDALLQRGMIERDRGNQERALADLERVHDSLDPADNRVPSVVLNIAHTLILDGDAAAARRRLADIENHDAFERNQTLELFKQAYRGVVAAMQLAIGEWDDVMKELARWPSGLHEVDISDVMALAGQKLASSGDARRARQAYDFALRTLPPARNEQRHELELELSAIGART